jgi:hypothetical protein
MFAVTKTTEVGGRFEPRPYIEEGNVCRDEDC